MLCLTLCPNLPIYNLEELRQRARTLGGGLFDRSRNEQDILHKVNKVNSLVPQRFGIKRIRKLLWYNWRMMKEDSIRQVIQEICTMGPFTKFTIILCLQILSRTKAESTIQSQAVIRQGKDLYSYPEETKHDYPPLTHPTSYYTREGFLECPPNSFTSFIGRGLNFLILKIGAVALVKAILAGLLLIKVPLFFLKMVFLKTVLFPVLIAPLLLHLFNNQQTQEMKPAGEEQAPDSNGGMGRLIEDDLYTKVWSSIKMFAESEQCVERVACLIGAHNKDTQNEIPFKRALKLFETSSSSNVQERLASIREAFKNGARNGSCSERDFKCHGPELFIQQGNDKMQLL